MLPLETNRLILRDFELYDFEAFFATSRDPEYNHFYSEEETTRKFWKGIFERILSSKTEQVRMSYQVAIVFPSGELIGTCGVRTEDQENQQASFGCAIAKSYWGMGLAFEASQRIIDFGFSTLPLHRIFAETNSENTRARSLAEHLGMSLEGELRENRFFRGRWWNTAIYSILEDQWNSGPSPAQGTA
jgi:ribosomal-protein-alanine N-acetyltransferase